MKTQHHHVGSAKPPMGSAIDTNRILLPWRRTGLAPRCVLVTMFTTIVAMTLFARPIPPEEAEVAVNNWLNGQVQFFDKKMDSPPSIVSVKTKTDEEGVPLFHIVETDSGATVIASAESGVEPIVAVSFPEEKAIDPNGPFMDILRGDMAIRIDNVLRARAQETAGDKDAAKDSIYGAIAEAESKWDLLLDDGFAPSKYGVSSISDVRVAALVQSKWDQGNVGSSWCYNYYTPNHYVCGCVATAAAQVMRYWQYPTASIPSITRTCEVNGSSTSRTSNGGTFAWSSMPLVPSSSMTTAQRQAIGHLCYDVGVSVKMNWTSGESGSSGFLLPDAFTGVFGYASALCCTHAGYGGTTASFTQTQIKNAIWASLDAGCPSVIGIYGHEVVADGYGFQSGTAYTHLNMGWSGDYNVWYNLPTVSAGSYSSSALDEVVYNIHKTRTGDLLTGRVLTSSGSPVSGATVTATYNSSVVASATTDTKGIYALWVTGGRTYSVTASSGSQTKTESIYVTHSISESTDSAFGAGTIGNSWGNDLTLQTQPLPDLAFYAPNGWPAAVYLASSAGSMTAQTTFSENQPIWLNFAIANTTSTSIATSFKRSVVLKNSSNTTIASYYFNTSGLEGLTYIDVTDDDLTGGLSAGTYTVTVTIDSDNSVSESNESNNSQTITFTVSSPGTLRDAVDNYSLTFTTGGNSSWYSQTATSYDGVDAARSGSIGSNQETWMQATGASGSGIVSFRWKVSSEAGYDWVEFYIDGVFKFGWSGTGEDWRYEAFKVGSGSHTFRWVYVKDGSYYSGSDCAWVDQVKFAPNSPLSPVYRFYSRKYRGHFFTMNEGEMVDLVENNRNWNYEGVAYFAYPNSIDGTVPLYRFYSKKYRGHFYTRDYNEYWSVRMTNPNWKYEGEAFYIRQNSGNGAIPIYRFWSKAYHHHFYTASYDEYLTLYYSNPNWAYESIAFYAWATPESLANASSNASKSENGNEAGEASGTGDSSVDGASLANGPSAPIAEAEEELNEGLRRCALAGRRVFGEEEGVFPLGAFTLETRLERPDDSELAEEAIPFRGPVVVPSISLALPEAADVATLWAESAAEPGQLGESSPLAVEEVSDASFEFVPEALQKWYQVIAMDADDNVVFSLWMRLLP